MGFRYRQISTATAAKEEFARAFTWRRRYNLRSLSRMANASQRSAGPARCWRSNARPAGRIAASLRSFRWLENEISVGWCDREIPFGNKATVIYRRTGNLRAVQLLLAL